MDFSNLWKHCYRSTHASFQTAYNYVTYRYQQSHCLAALPAKMYAFNSHIRMQATKRLAYQC